VTVDGESSSFLPITIEELVLSVSCYICLKRGGLNTVGDLIQRTENDLMDLRNFSHQCLDEVNSKLAELGLTLRKD
jgi:DNA-directed RNA polymerase subunit alpha